MTTQTDDSTTQTAGPLWLAEMPPAPCPVGSVVRKGANLGVVIVNEDDGWSVSVLGHYGAEETDEDYPDGQTLEAAGWRHALDHRNGFSYVWSEVQGHCGYISNDHSTEFEVMQRWVHGELTDDDYLTLARAFAAVSR